MRNTNIAALLFKGFSLLIFDIVTFMLVFSAWALISIPLFPWAFCAILFSLIMVNAVVLAANRFIQLFGVGMFISVFISTSLYYLFVMIFTGVEYGSITTKWYLIVILIMTLLYIAIASGLYISGSNKNKDMFKQEIEQSKVLDVNLQLMTIDQNIKKCRDSLEKLSYDSMVEAFSDMNERLKASTPFGRTNRPAALNFENQIIQQLSMVDDDIVLLKNIAENQKACKSITEILNNIKVLIINREKLIIQ